MVSQWRDLTSATRSTAISELTRTNPPGCRVAVHPLVHAIDDASTEDSHDGTAREDETGANLIEEPDEQQPSGIRQAE